MKLIIEGIPLPRLQRTRAEKHRVARAHDCKSGLGRSKRWNKTLSGSAETHSCEEKCHDENERRGCGFDSACACSAVVRQDLQEYLSRYLQRVVGCGQRCPQQCGE